MGMLQLHVSNQSPLTCQFGMSVMGLQSEVIMDRLVQEHPASRGHGQHPGDGGAVHAEPCQLLERATNTVSAAITPRFITPPTNSSSISAQQQPTQKNPCSRPMRKAPANPLRQRLIRNPKVIGRCAGKRASSG
jgi:hypothetical protein